MTRWGSQVRALYRPFQQTQVRAAFRGLRETDPAGGVFVILPAIRYKLSPMRAMLLPISVVLALIFAVLAWQALHGHQSAADTTAGLLNERLAARFGGFDALDTAIKKYTAS